MTDDEIDVFADALGPIVKELIVQSTTGLVKRLAEAEAQIVVLKERGSGIRGAMRSADGNLVLSMSTGELLDVGAVDGKPGRDADMAQVKTWVAEAAKEAAIVPDPVAVADVLKDQMVGTVREMIALEFATIPTPADGKDADPELIKEFVAEAFAAVPMPVDGKDADPNDVADVLRESVATQVLGEAMSRAERYLAGIQKAVADNADSKIEALIEKRWAELPVPADGKDGEPGKDGIDGKSVEIIEVTRMVDESVKLAVDTLVLPVPKDGRDGVDGSDGKSVEVSDVVTAMRGEVEIAVFNAAAKMIDDHFETMPTPKDGVDGKPGEPGEPGKSVELDEVVAALLPDTLDHITKMSTDFLAAIPKPKDGVDGVDAPPVDVKAVAQELRETLEPDVLGEAMTRVDEWLASIPEPDAGKDGVDGKSVSLDEVVSAMRDVVNGEAMKVVDDNLLAFAKANTAQIKGTLEIIEAKIEQRIAEIPEPVDGKSVELDEVVSAMRGAVGNHVLDDVMKRVDSHLATIPAPKDGEPGKDGKSVDPTEVAALLRPAVAAEVLESVTKQVEAHVSNIPLPKDGEPGKDGVDGKSVEPTEVAALLRPEVATEVLDYVSELTIERIAAIPVPKDGQPGADGKSVDPEEIIAAIEPVVVKRIDDLFAAVPPPEPGKDGASVTTDDVVPLIEEAVTKAVEALPKPRDGVDGVGFADALIDQDRRLVLTFSDGRTKEVGVVVGKDADMDALADVIVTEIAKIPRPKDGKDALGFDDLEVKYDGERTITLVFANADNVREFPIKLPIPIFRKLWEAGRDYETGDTVTWDGSLWSAVQDTGSQPGTSPAWRLAAQKGRPGRNTETVKVISPVSIKKPDEPKDD